MSTLQPMNAILRKIEIQVNEDWVVTEMKDLKEGDIFRMTEPNEDTPFGTWVATSDANDNYPGADGEPVWGISVDRIEL